MNPLNDLKLDTLTGTDEERGLTQWNKVDPASEKGEGKDSTYDLPFGMSRIRSWRWTRYVPVCPTFNMDWVSCKKTRKQDIGDRDDWTDGSYHLQRGNVNYGADTHF